LRNTRLTLFGENQDAKSIGGNLQHYPFIELNDRTTKRIGQTTGGAVPAGEEKIKKLETRCHVIAKKESDKSIRAGKHELSGSSNPVGPKFRGDKKIPVFVLFSGAGGEEGFFCGWAKAFSNYDASFVLVGCLIPSNFCVASSF